MQGPGTATRGPGSPSWPQYLAGGVATVRVQSHGIWVVEDLPPILLPVTAGDSVGHPFADLGGSAPNNPITFTRFSSDQVGVYSPPRLHPEVIRWHVLYWAI